MVKEYRAKLGELENAKKELESCKKLSSALKQFTQTKVKDQRAIEEANAKYYLEKLKEIKKAIEDGKPCEEVFDEEIGKISNDSGNGGLMSAVESGVRAVASAARSALGYMTGPSSSSSDIKERTNCADEPPCNEIKQWQTCGSKKNNCVYVSKKNETVYDVPKGCYNKPCDPTKSGRELRNRK